MNKKEKIIYIIAGANGTGKTTLAKELLKEFKLDFLNADELALAIDPQNITKARIRAGKFFIKKIEALLKKPASFAVETTLAGLTMLNTIRRARKQGFKIKIVYFFVDNPEVAIDRIKLRVKKGGHPVPEEDVIRRFPRSKSNFWHIYRKVADEWTMFYNGTDRGIVTASGDGVSCEIFDEELFKIFNHGMKK